MFEAGLRPTNQGQIDAVARVNAGEYPPAEMLKQILTAGAFQDELVDSVRTVLADTAGAREWRTALQEIGITARSGWYAQLIGWLDRPPESNRHQKALNYTAALGQGTVTVYGTRCTLDEAIDDDLANGPLAILDAADRTPTVAVRLGPAFRNRPSEQRKQTLAVLGELGRVCDIAVVTTRLTARWLVEQHTSKVPTEFTEWVNTRREESVPAVDDVEGVAAELDSDGRGVRILQLLAAEPGDTLAQQALVASQSVGKSAVSQTLDGLEDHGLVERYQVGRENHVELQPVGTTVLDCLEDDAARQTKLDRLFNDTRQLGHRTCNHACKDVPPKGTTADQPTADGDSTAYRTRFLDQSSHAAAGSVALEGSITAAKSVLPEPEDAEERHTRFVSYDNNRDEAVITVRATSPIQYITSVALAFSSPRFLDKTLPPAQLEKIDLSTPLLRDARCIGALSDEAAECGEKFRTQLIEWGEHIEEMTRKYHHNDVDDRDALCGEILRSAHGLAGTITHLLDVVGVDVIRELRVPSKLDQVQLSKIAKTVSVAVSIQSRYGHYAAYRQLFESREKKRQVALSPEVDAEDPVGQYIGSLVLRGPSSTRLARHVEGILSSPAPIQSDAPEFAVEVPIDTPNRAAYTEVVNRMGGIKNICATSEAVTLFRALTGDVYSVADALHWLSTEDQHRRIRLDEVRVSLAALDSNRLLPDAPPTLSKAVATLLRTASPLTQTALAEKADVSSRSIGRHIDGLVALDIVRLTDEGLRLALPFDDGDERGERILPAAVDEGATVVQELAFDVASVLLDDSSRLGNLDDPVGAAFVWPPDFEALRTHLPDIDPYLRIAKALSNTPESPATTVEFGATVQQMSLQASASEHRSEN